MDKIDGIKKDIRSFIKEEDGKIPKQSIIVMGTILTVTSLSMSVYAGKGGGGGGGSVTGGPGPEPPGPYPTYNCDPPCGESCHANSISLEMNTDSVVGTHSHGAFSKHCSY